MNDSDSEKLIARLQQLPEKEVPPYLVENIMAQIRPAKTGFWAALLQFLMTPRPVVFRPITGFALSSLVVVLFSVSMFLERHETAQLQGDRVAGMLTKAMQDSEASFLVGRGLLAAGLPGEALPLLQKASLTVPDNPEYAYWEGICFWANGMPEKERSSYQRGITSSPETVPLLLNLGHNFLEEKNFQEALVQYDRVLSLVPKESTALYNKALIYHLQQQEELAKIAWVNYLEHYRYGRKSFRAVRHLNNLNDFTYRIYQLGGRKIILKQSALLDMRPQNQLNKDVEILTSWLRYDPVLDIHLVFFHEDDISIAKHKAIEMKKRIVTVLGEQVRPRVRLSWFNETEVIETASGKIQPPESLLIFGTKRKTLQEETEI